MRSHPSKASRITTLTVSQFAACPAGYPVRLVTLFYEVRSAHFLSTTALTDKVRLLQIMYDVDSWKNLWPQAMNTSQPFVLAMGDPTGCAASPSKFPTFR